MITYLDPAFAIVHGAVFLHEDIGPHLLFGFGLILAGVIVVNGWPITGRPRAANMAGRENAENPAQAAQGDWHSQVVKVR